MAEANFFDQFDEAPFTAKPEVQTEKPAQQPATNFFDQFDKDDDAGEIGLKERARLNALDSYYRGTLGGAADLRNIANAAKMEPGKETDPQERQRVEVWKGEYDKIVGDLARFDLMKPWSSTAEATVALAGQVGGAMLTPENFIALPVRGASMAVRALWAAGGQGAIQLATDPVVQTLSIGSGVQKEYEPLRTALAPVMGAIIGGGLHVGGELVGQSLIKSQRAAAAVEDPQFRSATEVPGEVVQPEAKAPVIDLDNHVGETTITVNGQKTIIRDGVPEVAPEPVVAEAAVAGKTKGKKAPASEAAVEATPEAAPETALMVRRQVGEELALRGQQASAAEEQALAQRRGGSTLAMERARPSEGIAIQSADAAATGSELATVPQTITPREGAIKSLQQQAFDFADAIGFPLRQGRNRAGTLGTYNVKSGVVRVKEAPDFEVVAHEAGHAIEAKAGKALTDLTERFPNELKVLDYDQGPGGQRVNEGFAEWIRRYIGNPAHAEQVAPSFTTAFRDFMSRNHPEILSAIDQAGAAYRAYIEAPSLDAIHAVVRSRDEDPTGWRGMVKQAREEGFPAVYRSVMQKAYTAMFDDKAPVARAVRDMVKAIRADTGAPVELKAADNPEVLIRLFARTEQAAVRDMIDGVRPYQKIEPEGPSLTQAIAKAAGDPTMFGKWNEDNRKLFADYLVARRAEVLWRRFERGDLQNPPVSFSKGDALRAMAELEQGMPTFREASDMVHAYTRQILRKMYEGGLIDTDLYTKLIKEEFYVPFMRDLSDKPLSAGDSAGGGARDRVAEVVHGIKGSSRDIKDPLESLMMQTFLVNRTIRHNDVIRSFVSLADRAGPEGGRYVEKIPAYEARQQTFDLSAAIEKKAREAGMDPNDARMFIGALSDLSGEDPLLGSFFKMEPAGKRGEPLVFYKEGGEMKAARFMANDEGHALYETLTALPGGLQDLSLQVLSVSSGLLRSGVVTNPTYAFANYIRDQMAVFLLRPDYMPFISGAKGVVQEVKQSQPAKLYGYAGGVSAGASVAPLKQAAEADINALAKQGYVMSRMTSLHGLLELTSIAEAGTRNSVFAKVFESKRRAGLSDYEAMIEAAYASQDVLDFSRHGSKTQAVIALTPFVNSWAQGMDKARRTMIQPIIDRIRDGKLLATDQAEFSNAILSTAKVAGMGAALGAAWAALHSKDQGYQDASTRVKATHFVTSMGGKLVVIPKPFELSLGFTAGEYAYQRLAQNDPRAAEQFAEAAWEVLQPPVPVFANPLIKTSAELALGKSFFTKRDLVLESLQRLDSGQQYTDRTSSLAKLLGKQIDVSPIKIDHAIGGYFGLWGRDVMAMSSGIDERAPAANWQDHVFLRRFIKDPTRTSDVTTKFWEFMGQTTGKYNQAVATYENFLKSFRDQEGREFLDKLKQSEKAFVIMKSAANEDGKPAFKADEKRLHPLQRSYDAVTILNGLRRELADNSFKSFETGANLPLNPTQRRDVIDAVRELAQAEMFNGLQIMKEPGYENRPRVETQPILDKIRAASSEVADEVVTRYATSRIYKAEAVANAYPKMQSELLRFGSEADLGSLAADAGAEGYEFGGERVKKPQKRRVAIQPQAAR